jgi:hypothetical protein
MGPPPATTVRSAIEIQAPLSTVWAYLAEFDPIAAPVRQLVLPRRRGVSDQRDADGRAWCGVMRVCDFSTGRFVETVRVWEENHRLMFTIESGPPVLREWSPYGDIHPPHVQGYFVPRVGRLHAATTCRWQGRGSKARACIAIACGRRTTGVYGPMRS